MATFKVVISDPKTKLGFQKEVDQTASGLMGKKIGDKVSGDAVGLSGYELEITGGSDKQGFPMRADVMGAVRKKIILAFPPGFHPDRKGQRRRKSIHGNTIAADVVQVNTKIVKHGAKSLDDLGFKSKKVEGKKESKAEGKKEEKMIEKKEERKQEEKKEEKPAEEKKHEPKQGEKPAHEKPTEPAATAEAKMGVKPVA